MNALLFHDRHDAGTKLAEAVLAEMASAPAAEPIVYALPKGGLDVAEPVARLLHCPMDVVIAKKITQPRNPETAIGAVTPAGDVLWSVYQPTKVAEEILQQAFDEAQSQAQIQLAQFTAHFPSVSPKGKVAIVVDDGIATGMTMAVAVQTLREQQSAEIWICVPVAPASLLKELQKSADRVIILHAPEQFSSVSRFYNRFPQLTMEAAIECLQRHHDWLGSRGDGSQ